MGLLPFVAQRHAETCFATSHLHSSRDLPGFRVEPIMTPTDPVVPHTTLRLETMDAVEFLSQMEKGSASLVVTDPAYESLEKHRNRGTTTRLKKSKGSSNDWFPIFPNTRFPELFAEIYRVLAKNSHFYMVCDQDTMWVVRAMAEAAGFKYWKFLVWHKLGRIGMGYHYRAVHEVVLFFEKGKRKLQDLSIPDVLAIPKVSGGYPTEKPLMLSRVLLEQSSLPGELVLDPFMGSGFVARSARLMGRAFAGCDISPQAVQLVRDRLVDDMGIGAEEPVKYADIAPDVFARPTPKNARPGTRKSSNRSPERGPFGVGEVVEGLDQDIPEGGR